MLECFPWYMAGFLVGFLAGIVFQVLVERARVCRACVELAERMEAGDSRGCPRDGEGR